MLVQVRIQVGHRALFTLSFFICFPAHPGPGSDSGNTSHLPNSLLESCGADGIIYPRASSDPLLEGEVFSVTMGNIPQHI